MDVRTLEVFQKLKKSKSEILEQQSNLNLDGKMPDYVDTEISITNAKIEMLKCSR